MPVYVNESGVIERITFSQPVRVEKAEIETAWWQKAINAFWRMVSGA